MDHVAAAPAPHPATAEVVDAITRNYGRRRSDKPGRDQLVYRHGAALEVAGALDMDDYFLLGALVSPEVLTWIVSAAQDRLEVDHTGADICLVTLLRCIFEKAPRRRYLINLGAWQRLSWDRSAYLSAVEEFEAGVAAHGGEWRSRPITPKQRYLIDQIVRAREALNEAIARPDVRDRGEAHDWIRLQRGNPRFWSQPQPPKPSNVSEDMGVRQ